MFFRSKDPSQIRLSEVESYLNKKFSKELDEEKRKIKNSVASIFSKFNEIKNAAEEMEKKHSEKSYAETVKAQYCDKCLGAIDGLHEPDNSYAQTLSFAQMAKLVLGTISNINFKEFKHLQEFKAEMSRISQTTKNIESELKSLENALYASVTKKIEDIGSLISDVSRSKKTFDDMETMLRDSGTSITHMKDDAEEYKHRLESLQKSFNYSEAESELRRVESQVSIIKQKILTDLGGLDKVVKKLVHEGEKSIDDYSKNMFEAFLKDNSSKLNEIIEKSLDAINSGRISVDAKQKDHIHRILKNLGSLSTLKDEYTDLTEHVESIKAEMHRKKDPAEKEIKKVEEELKEKEKELLQLTKKRELQITERKKLEERIRKTSEDIKKKLTEVLQKDIQVEA